MYIIFNTHVQQVKEYIGHQLEAAYKYSFNYNICKNTFNVSQQEDSTDLEHFSIALAAPPVKLGTCR